ncbi:DUF421 domain-containing protein [Bacillus shivajii]|uniref:DUF421 domain-containing protein n=1 Tax=Bacillus shivajii TaxID=1983719 RepID=UPI001CFB8E39|nr:DUF421 domain-containing protein [Bacillus shivajii]UCZ52595.1 DUF421 domain-containing protein [Bacillus shivajii]
MTDLGQVLVRGLIGFIVLLVLARIMGKKQINQITYFEYIVGIAIGSIAAELTFSPDIRISNFVFGMVIWSMLPIVVSKIELKSYGFRMLTEGKPTVVIENGKILEENLKKEDLTVDELMIYLRDKDVFKLSDVETAIFESSGQLSVMKKSDVMPITPKDMNMVVEQEHSPRIVIVDGNVMEKSLKEYGYTKDWLLGEVMKQGAEDFSDVFVAQIDSMGNVYVDLYNDKKKLPQIKQKLLAAATVKQLQANLTTFSLQTENEQAKKMYQDYAKTMEQLLDDMGDYLKE